MITRVLFFLISMPSLVFAQTKIKSIALTLEIVTAAVDRPGDIYPTTKDGKIQHFDLDGQLKATLSTQPDLFDPRDGSRLFAFYRKARRYDFLNPSFEVTKSIHLDSSTVVDPWLVCPSGDYNLWAIDAADRTLKKINPATSAITVEVALKDYVDLSTITFIREYQGFLFIHDSKKGIVVFSGMGRQLKTLGDGKITYFNFIGEELYYKEGNQLRLFNLFTTETRTVALPQPSQIALITDERMYLLDAKALDIFSAIR